MTLESMSHFCSSLLAYAGESAVRSIVLALAAALVLGIVRVKQPRLRLLSWTGVLYAAMTMPLLGLVLPAINLPLLPGANKTPAGRAIATAAAASAGRVVEPAESGSGAPPPSAVTTETAAPANSQRLAAVAGRHSWAGEAVTQGNSGKGNAALTRRAPTSFVVTDRQFGWWGLAALVYLLVGAVLIVRVITGLVLGRRLRKHALEIADPDVRQLLARLSGARTRSARVRLAESAAVSVPVAIGVLHPAILLPSDWRDWDRQKLSAVLAHELSHVARRDALTQLASAVHRSMFWFSPLPWWLHERLIDLGEQASDDSALLAVNDPALYAEVLLGFFQSLNAVPARWLGVSMARGARAGRRIERMLSGAPPAPARLKRGAAAAVAALAIALVVPAASLRIGRGRAIHGDQSKDGSRDLTRRAMSLPASFSLVPEAIEDQTGVGTDAVDSASTTIEGLNDRLMRTWELSAPIDGETGQQGAPPTPAPAPAPGAAPAAPAPAQVAPAGPVAAVPPAGRLSPIMGPAPFAAIAPIATLMAVPAPAPQDREVWTDDDRESFAIVKGNGSVHFTGMGSGDGERIRALRNKIKGDFIWFEHDGRSYIITDLAIVKEAEEFFAPQEELGKQQADLGAQQAALGAKQADLARQQASVKVEMPDLTGDIQKIADRMKGVKTQEELSELQSELSRLQSKLASAQSDASREQSRFGQLQSELGREQSELGRQQSLLGQQQSRIARQASRKVRLLLERALKDGLAQPEH